MQNIPIAFDPTPKQLEFIEAVLKYDRIFYGGAVGGGKSYGMMGIAGLLMDLYPGIVIRAIRETFPAVEQNLIGKFKEIYPEFDKQGRKLYKYNKSDHIIEWKNGSKIIFDYCSNLKDAMAKHGLEQDILMVDEAVEHQPDELRYLMNRTRTNKMPKPKVIFTGNPKGPALNYIRKEFVEATEFGEYVVEKHITSRDGLRVYKRLMKFVPAKLADNKYLMDTGYEAEILELPEELQRALLDGDWYVSLGAFFGNYREKIHTYDEGNPDYIIKDWYKKYIVVDWGINDHASVEWYAINEHGTTINYRELYINGVEVDDLGYLIVENTHEENIEHIMLPHDMFRRSATKIRNEQGDMIGDTSAEVLAEIIPWGIVRADASAGSRVRGWRATHRMLYYNEDKMTHPRLVINSNNTHMREQLRTIERHETNLEEIKLNQEDHCVDNLRMYSDAHFDGTLSMREKPGPKKNTPAWTKKRLAEKRDEISGDYSELYY